MKQHLLTLQGGESTALRVSADVLVEVVSALIEGARQATRLAVDGESTRKGPRPAWLDAACHFEVTGLTPGSVRVSLEAPTLADAAPDILGAAEQAALFADPTERIDGAHTAIDLFGRVLAAVIAGNGDAVLADRSMLDSCARFSRAARGRYGSIELAGISGLDRPLTVRPEDISTIERLRDQIPAPRATRLVGTLDTISITKPDVVLRLDDGSSVTARASETDVTALKTLFGEKVVVSGVAHFRPSGKVLRIDIEHLGPARKEDEVFARAPMSPTMPLASLLAQDDANGVADFFGAWPGDESDEELLASLEAQR